MNLQYLSLNKEFLFNWYEGLITKSIAHLEGKKLTNGEIEYYKQEFLKQYYTHFASIKVLYAKAMSLNRYDLGTRRLIPKSRCAPTQLADHFSRYLAKSGRNSDVVAFAERFFSDYGEGQTGVELALKRRADKSRMKVSP